MFKLWKTTRQLLLSSVLLYSVAVEAIPPQLQQFSFGSYQNILKAYQQQAFLLVIWATTCPSCVKDMALLSELHQKWPQLKMILLSTDEPEDTGQVQAILEKYQLSTVENWIFAEDNTQKLNYEIDPQWYGELPRTYFFDATHVRLGVSGVLSKKDYEDQFKKIMK